MNKRRIRDYLRLLFSLLFIILYIPHLLFYFTGKKIKWLIDSDIKIIEYQTGINGLPRWLVLIDLLHNNRYFRNIFYHRIGPVKSYLLEFYRPGDRYFIIRREMKIGKSFFIAHPFSTVLNAQSIGDNFRCVHCTTLGHSKKGLPIIGNNVSLGASVTVIGGVNIGNNVIIGAGSVVVSDIPSNCVAVGNPCKPIKRLE